MEKDFEQFIPQMVEYSKRGFPLDQFNCSLKNQLTTLAEIFWLCALDLGDGTEEQKRAVHEVYTKFSRTGGNVPSEDIAEHLRKAGLNVDKRTVRKAFPYDLTRSRQKYIVVPGRNIVMEELGIGPDRWYRVYTGWLQFKDPKPMRLDYIHKTVCMVLKRPIEGLVDIVETCIPKGDREGSLSERILRVLLEADSPLPDDEVAETLGVKRYIVYGALQRLCRAGLVDTRRGEGYYIHGRRF